VDAAPTVVDPHAERLVRGLIGELAEDLGSLEGTLASLSGIFDEGLPGAVVGAMGLNVGEIRQQLPALREAAREMGLS